MRFLREFGLSVRSILSSGRDSPREVDERFKPYFERRKNMMEVSENLEDELKINEQK